MNPLVITATNEELDKAMEFFPDIPRSRFKKVGVGASEILGSFNYMSYEDYKETDIINFGYVGSNILPIGMIVEIGTCSFYRPKANRILKDEGKTYTLNHDMAGKYPIVHCFTAMDFIEKRDLYDGDGKMYYPYLMETPVVFDMELCFLRKYPFNSVRSIKIVSDNLSIAQYEQNTK